MGGVNKIKERTMSKLNELLGELETYENADPFAAVISEGNIHSVRLAETHEADVAWALMTAIRCNKTAIITLAGELLVMRYE